MDIASVVLIFFPYKAMAEGLALKGGQVEVVGYVKINRHKLSVGDRGGLFEESMTTYYNKHAKH